MSEDLSERLARWSRRKLAARRGSHDGAAPAPSAEARTHSAGTTAPAAPGDERRPAATTAATKSVPPEAKRNDERTSEDARPVLPSIDELDANSDYTPFLQKGAPQELTNAALRKLWASDPVFAVLDGLNDYDEDFNVIDQAITTAQTNYKVGRGYLDEELTEHAKDDGAPVTSAANRQGDLEVKQPAAPAGDEDAPVETADTPPRPVAAVEWDDAEKVGKADSESSCEKSSNSEG